MLRTISVTALGAILFVVSGCDDHKRIARLEKQNQELQAAVKKKDSAAEYEMQEKCARSAKVWFGENWNSDKDTLLLDHTNHYNKAENKCFVFIEYHDSTDRVAGSWVNHMSLWDVNENAKYGEMSEYHTVFTKPEFHVESNVMICESSGSKCQNVDEFKKLVQPFMNN